MLILIAIDAARSAITSHTTVTRELRAKNHMKIVSLAPEVL
jgi:ribosomal protein L14